jgi:exonuclease SbcC
VQIAAGERKQFGESMTEQVEKIIGMNFEKLKIASIVQQGELNSIINAKPKEFKELLNAIIGIDKLDIASESMKKITKEFREENRTKSGHDDSHIDILEKMKQENQNKLDNAVEEKIGLELQKNKIKEQISKLEAEVVLEEGKKGKIIQLKDRKIEFKDHVDNEIKNIKKENQIDKEKIDKCEGCFEKLKEKKDVEKNLENATKEEGDASNRIQEIGKEIASLEEQKKLSEKLQLKDSKCPVCDSIVEKLNPLFQNKNLEEKIKKLRKEIDLKEKEKGNHCQEKIKATNKFKEITASETILETYSIKNKEELVSIQNDIEAKEKKLQLADSGKLEEMSQIDEHAKSIFEKISKLESETKGFDEAKFEEKIKELKEKRDDKEHNDKNRGIVENQIKTTEKIITETKESILELEKIKDYISKLDNIQKHVFSRDGSVATSLRSWALNSISMKASEYLSVLNTKIQRIALSEKARNVSIECHSKTEVLELESLSGGEKVSVALALRLGMANLLGSSNLNLMILDEPTTHLDAERKKSLVEVLAQLSKIGKAQTAMQFLIITHDAEIFENEYVGQIHEFKSTEEGSKVTEL